MFSFVSRLNETEVSTIQLKKSGKSTQIERTNASTEKGTKKNIEISRTKKDDEEIIK